MELERVPNIKRELDRLRRDLVAQFNDECWGDLDVTLDRLASFGEANGSLEICIRAQSIRQWLGEGRRTFGEPAPQGSIERGALAPHVDDLVHQLSHLRWASAQLAG